MKLTPNTDFRADLGMHIVHFKAGEPLELPDAVAKKVIEAYGAFFEKGTPQPAAPKSDVKSVDEVVLEVVKTLFDEGDPDNFTKSGRPKMSALKARLPKGYEGLVDADRVSAAVDAYLAEE